MIKFKTDSTKLNMSHTVIWIVTLILVIFLVIISCYYFYKCSSNLSRRQILVGVDNQGNHIILERIDPVTLQNTIHSLQENFERPYEMVENEDPEKTCSICLDEIGETECKLKCGHGYHFNCIRQWAYVERKNSCPQCREAIIEINI